jgi:hypothetical protein
VVVNFFGSGFEHRVAFRFEGIGGVKGLDGSIFVCC